MKILGLSGSLRAHSVNTGLLKAAAEVAPAGVELTIHDYAEVPLYNADLDRTPAVHALREAITEAYAVLIATPEYNYSIPGVLKNAIDWASRPAYQSPFRDKPTGVLSSAASFAGGARAQQHLKTVLLGMAAPVFPWPEFLVGSAMKKFDKGQLVDDDTRKFLTEYMAGFSAWLRRG